MVLVLNICYSYFALPVLDSCYSTLKTSLLVPALPLRVWDFDINESFLVEEVTIQTDLDLTRTPCPVNPENSERWTREQREIAASATVVTSLEDLRTKVNASYIHFIILIVWPGDRVPCWGCQAV
jgi:hypothetical protein